MNAEARAPSRMTTIDVVERLDGMVRRCTMRDGAPAEAWLLVTPADREALRLAVLKLDQAAMAEDHKRLGHRR